MPEPVETTDPEGVDFGWVVQVTFVVSILVGFPVAAAVALSRDLPTWVARAVFAVRVAAVVWLVVGVAVFAYARYRR
ncbi:MAG: DUF5822 domain-containing protein [Halanaeroarchaeum sp.]